MSARRKGKRILGGCAIVLIVLVALVFLTPQGKALLDLRGYISDLMAPDEFRKYDASSSQNLEAIYTALSLYSDSEGQFPVASGWMDAIQDRIRASDMKQAEAEKKLIRPDLLPPKQGVFGYAMNDKASGKYKGDIKDPKKTVLIYESDDTSRNAHGDPSKSKRRIGITVDGTIVKL